MSWKGGERGINFSFLSDTHTVDSRHTREIGVHQEVGREKNGVELLQCYRSATDPPSLSLPFPRDPPKTQRTTEIKLRVSPHVYR